MEFSNYRTNEDIKTQKVITFRWLSLMAKPLYVFQLLGYGFVHPLSCRPCLTLLEVNTGAWVYG